jgi:hypothetical protein
MTVDGIGGHGPWTWPEVLAQLDAWCEALTSDHEITPVELDAYATDLAQRAYVLSVTAVRRERLEVNS